MEKLPGEVCLKIFQLFDHQTLATALQDRIFQLDLDKFFFPVCRKWQNLASDDILWLNLFKRRWGEASAKFFAPEGSKSWKDVYIVQDRCDQYGLGLKIIREGRDYYLIYQGEIQRYLGEAGLTDCSKRTCAKTLQEL